VSRNRTGGGVDPQFFGDVDAALWAPHGQHDESAELRRRHVSVDIANDRAVNPTMARLANINAVVH
jgi:hypothetical protein